MTSDEKFARFAHTDGIKKDLRSKSVRGAAAVATSGGADFFIRLGSTFILARLLLPEHYGLVGMVSAITAIAAEVSHLGLSSATVQRTDITHKQVSNLFWINAAFGSALCLLLAASSPLVAMYYREPRLLPVMIAMSTSFLFGGLKVQHEALLHRQMKLGHLAGIRLCSSVLSTGLSIFLAYAGYSYWALVWQEIGRSMLLMIGVWVLCPWIPGLPRRDTSVRSLLNFGVNLTLNQLITSLITNLDRLLLGRYFGASSVGLFRQAQQLMMVPVEQMNAPIQSVAQPGLSMLQGDPDRFRRFYQKIVFVISFVTMPIAIFAAVYSEEIALIVLGPKWDATGPILRIFAIAAFVRPTLGTTGVVMISCGHSGRLLKFTLARSVTMILLMIVGIRWGVQGVAMAQVGNTLVLILPSLFYGLYKTPVNAGHFFGALSTPLMASLVMAAGLIFFHSFELEMGVMANVFCGLIFAVIFYLGVCFSLPWSRRELLGLIDDLRASGPMRFRRSNQAEASS